jgi:hypothetical protein
MLVDVKMTIGERRKYLLRMRVRYVAGSRNQRSQLLDEMEQVTELHRKSLIRLMQEAPVRQPRQAQRGRTYGPQVDDALRVIAETLDCMICTIVCSLLKKRAPKLRQFKRGITIKQIIQPASHVRYKLKDC